jgi:uncharacterized flavoprotein (TIGR03862 family)
LKDVKKAVIIGAGPAGLFAAHLLLNKGIAVDLYDRNTSPGRKFLLAGRSGLNLTNAEDPSRMASRYGRRGDLFLSLLQDFSSDSLREWLGDLGVPVKVGNGGKVFPENASAGDILDLWWEQLAKIDRFRYIGNSRFIGWDEDGLHLRSGEKDIFIAEKPVLFALGGASWPGTGSDGAWGGLFRDRGIDTVPFKPMNCAFTVDWSSRFRESRTDKPLKNIVLIHGGDSRRGELTLTAKGLEGGPVYWFSLPLREEIESKGTALIHLDLAPDRSEEQIAGDLKKRPNRKSLTSYLKGTLRFSPQKAALIYEAFRKAGDESPPELAQGIKRLPLTLTGTDTLERSISVSGGVSLSGLDDFLMIRKSPGYFTAGEMIDWESPTGGYLLQGCFSTAYRAAKGMEAYLS